MLAALVIAAAGLRAVYAVALLGWGLAPWYGTWSGPDVRIPAILNLGAVAILVAGAMVRRHDLVWGACLVALLTHGLPGARIGEWPMQLLPWATATTALLMVAAARRRIPELVAATGIGLVAFAAWLAVTLAWAALDYAIAAAAVVLVVAVAALVRRPPPSDT